MGCRRPPRHDALGHRSGGPVTRHDLVEAALRRAATGPSEDVSHAASLSWEVEQLLDYLEREGTAIETRARLEFLLMPILQYTRPARALSEALQAQPALFAELMSYVYRADGEPINEDVTPEREAIATVGYSAIRSWHTPPDCGLMDPWTSNVFAPGSSRPADFLQNRDVR